MSSRSLGELLLRPSTFTRIAFTPAARLPATWTAQRHISNTGSDPAAPRARVETSETATTPEVAASSPRSSTSAASAIDSLFPGPTSSNRSPTTPDPSNQIDRVFGANFSKPASRRGRVARSPVLDFSSMEMPTDGIANPSFANKPPPSTLAQQQAATFENYPRLNPAYGRAVSLDVSRGRDLVRGIGMLGSLLARNKVKADMNRQRFHERGGLKRKRLNSERWRARFKEGFRAMTARVSELTKKGW